MYFHQDMFAPIKKDNPTFNAAQVAKEIGAKWQVLTDDVKAPYLKKQVDDKVRYDKEMALEVQANGGKKLLTNRQK